MTYHNLQILKELTHGSFGSVWLGRFGADSSKGKGLIVVKKISVNSLSLIEKEKVKQEVIMLASLKHPNIVSYKGSLLQESYLCILMGFCEGGDLYEVIKNQNNHLFPEFKIIRWFIQIVMAISYLHQRHILHRDLKTRNIFLTKAELIKVGDFGISKKMESSQELTRTIVGTPLYMSPEILAGIPYNQGADIWSLGCCLFEMITLQHPFQSVDLCSLIFKISNGMIGKIPKCYNEELVKLVHLLLQNEPEMRPSASALLKMDFMQKQIEFFLSETIEIEEMKTKKKNVMNVKKSSCVTENIVINSPSDEPFPCHSVQNKGTGYLNWTFIKKETEVDLPSNINHSDSSINLNSKYHDLPSVHSLARQRRRDRKKTNSGSLHNLNKNSNAYESCFTEYKVYHKIGAQSSDSLFYNTESSVSCFTDDYIEQEMLPLSQITASYLSDYSSSTDEDDKFSTDESDFLLTLSDTLQTSVQIPALQ